jgi:hypothetical protein
MAAILDAGPDAAKAGYDAAVSERGEDTSRPSRWQRRELRRKRQRERLQKHGASLRRIYADAVRKRAKDAKPKSN